MTLDEVLESVLLLGDVTSRPAEAAELVAGLRDRLHHIAAVVAERRRPRLAVLEWTDPLFSAGHWVPDMVAGAGADSVIGTSGQRSRQVDWSALDEAAPEIVVVAPCGYRLDRGVPSTVRASSVASARRC